jgi:hypothetical protein
VSYEREIVCLAASSRPGGLCYAGKEVQAKTWLRPVGDRATHEIKPWERLVGHQPALPGDTVRIPLDRADPKTYQTENHVISGKPWQRTGHLDYAGLRGYLDAEQPLWPREFDTSHGTNDKLRIGTANRQRSSLRLIEVRNLAVIVQDETFDEPKIGVRAKFTHAAQSYLLRITDPAVRDSYRVRGVGRYDVGRAILCISLSEELYGYAYKLAAGVFIKP